MKPSSAAFALSREFEQLRLFAYPDPASQLARATPEYRRRWGFEDAEKLIAALDPRRRAASGSPWTIGYGHTRDVKPGDRVTEHQADVLHEFDLNESWALAEPLVTVPITQGMCDAITTFVNNVGLGAKGSHDGFHMLFSGHQSTILTMLLARNYIAARKQLLTWTRAGGVVLDGLKRRRAAEYALWGDTQPDFSNVVSGVESTAEKVS